tara:strand:- start:173 stop:664 length:492 start_codon:yes stop_codon:yes gene_type:complete
MSKIIKQEISIIEKRKAQAEVIKPIFEEMVSTLGKTKAKKILKNAIIKNAIDEGRVLREKSNKTSNKNNVIDQFIEVFENWKTGGALEINEIKKDNEIYHFDVTRCKYAEMYSKLGIKELGGILSCNRDSNFSKGFDKNLILERNQTIMEGSSCCTFRYKLEK